jgi:hypothetical protein
MHSYAWHTGFNLDTEFIEEVPVCIELPLRKQILEPNRRALISNLGKLIHYQAGHEHSEYSNDIACILWSTQKPVPKKLKLVYRNLTLWQDISFKACLRHVLSADQQSIWHMLALLDNIANHYT